MSTSRTTIDKEMNWQFSEEEKLVTCPWHYWKFDIETGESALAASAGTVAASARVRVELATLNNASVQAYLLIIAV